MENFSSLKEDLLAINQDLLSLFTEAGSLPGSTEEAFEDWVKACTAIQHQLPEEILRLAVVGAIKSGKSTFVNSLFEGDYLKRGAGVVTSIVTKIRTGEQLRAKLFFKFWEDINREIQQALALFPALEWEDENQRFEIRRAKERQTLQSALDKLSTDLLFNEGTRNVNSVLLGSYLKGFDRVKDIIASDHLTQEYTAGNFSEHTAFVGDDSLSVYLKDIQLEVDFDGIDRDIEIADCQGSDSPNPLHLAMIQDYLLLTHLIVYVISSRTGVRQADIRFLSLIKKMGIMDNILFVVNCDFSEHGSLQDLQRLTTKVREELALLKPDPQIYTLSALYNLFRAPRLELAERDRLRLAQWRQDETLAEYSDAETRRFKEALERKLGRERYALLLANHLERLGVIATGLRYWIQINREVLSRDTEGALRIVEKIGQHQERVDQIKTMVRSTLEGAIVKIKQTAKTAVDRLFDERHGTVIPRIVSFMREFPVPYEEYDDQLEKAGFAATMFVVFQDFKQALDIYLTETVNPEVVKYVREQEKQIKASLESVIQPYNAMVREALEEYNQAVGDFGIPRIHSSKQDVTLPELEQVKSIVGLRMPSADAAMRYSAHIKTEAVIHLGFYKLARVFRRLMRHPLGAEKWKSAVP